MPEKEIDDDELEEELEKAFRASEAKKDSCGKPITTSKEVGIQRTNVKVKKK